ncbi:MAG: glycolate oxidase subunit GlcF [Pseudomonadota bacterium]
MQTALADFIRDTPTGQEADRILRTCVHCGFCNATCPTYQLLGDELDGPRGRIYLIKQMLEGNAVTAHTLTHLDRCLTCRNCETTCPSGVRYGALLDIGRELAEQRIGRPWPQRALRWLIRHILPYPARFTPLLRLGQFFRPFLPQGLKRKIPPRLHVATTSSPLPLGEGQGEGGSQRHTRKMLVLEGCAQPSLAPNINAAATRVLDRLDIALIPAVGAGCCGAACHHTSGVEEGLAQARRNIDAWWPHLETGSEAIVMTASGCGVHVKDYGHLLRDDPAYADKARRVSALTKDISEILAKEDLSALRPRIQPAGKIAFQSPCTLQHGQKLGGVVEKILRDLGFELVPVPEAHLCCGSAGTYSLLQTALSSQLRTRKLAALESGKPQRIVTANIGCLAHLQSGTTIPVQHWVELIGE